MKKVNGPQQNSVKMISPVMMISPAFNEQCLDAGGSAEQGRERPAQAYEECLEEQRQ